VARAAGARRGISPRSPGARPRGSEPGPALRGAREWRWRWKRGEARWWAGLAGKEARARPIGPGHARVGPRA